MFAYSSTLGFQVDRRHKFRVFGVELRFTVCALEFGGHFGIEDRGSGMLSVFFPKASGHGLLEFEGSLGLGLWGLGLRVWAFGGLQGSQLGWQ